MSAGLILPDTGEVILRPDIFLDGDSTYFELFKKNIGKLMKRSL